MSDLDRRARRLVGGWPSGGLVVGLLPDSNARAWSGKAALELATAAAQERLAALVLDLAPDASDLADRFGAEPEPGFAQVMTGEVELSQIQHWDAARGAYYLPGGVRVLSDKVAKSRSVEALARRVKGQEGILFVLLDRHAAEAAAEAGWLDGVVRLGQANLGGPKMFSDVTALGQLERREPVQKPWERERRGAPDSASEPADASPEPSVEPTGSAAADHGDEADLTVEPDQATGPQPDETRPAAEEVGGTPETEAPAQTDEPLEPAASTETEVGDETAGPSGPELPGESAEPEGDGPATAVEVSEEAWEPRETVGTGVMDPPEGEDEAADGSEPPELEVVDASEEEPAEEPPVLEVPAEIWEPREAGGDRGVTDEPEIAAESDELEPGDEAEEVPEPEESESAGPEIVEADEVDASEHPPEPDVAAEPEVAEADEPAGPETAGAAEVEDTEEPAVPEVEDEEAPTEEVAAPGGEEGAEVEEQETADPDVATEPEVVEADEAAGAETGGTEIEDTEEPAVPEVEDEEVVSEEIGGAEVGTEPEITEEPDEAPGDEAQKVEEAGEASPAEEAEEQGEVDEESDEPEITGEPELSGTPEDTETEEPDETRLAAEAPGAEIEEPAAEELDRPAGLERFAEIPEDSTEAEPSPEVEQAGETEEVPPAAETDDEVADEQAEDVETAAETAEGPADEVGDGEVDEEEEDEGPPEIEAAEEEDGESGEPEEPVHTEVITSGLDVWPAEADQHPSRAESAETDAVGRSGTSGGDSPEPAGASVISAALWARPEENGGSGEPEETPKRDDFITAAMWAPEDSGDGKTAAQQAGGSVIVSRDGWAPAAGTVDTEEAATVVDDSEQVEEPVTPDAGTEEQEPVDAGEDSDSGEPQRADFILDGLELPPEWSEEWEEEERAAAEAAEQEEIEDNGASDGGEDAGKADFVTQGMGIPDEEQSGDPWPDSGTSTDWSRDTGRSSGTWERDPYGSSTGRAAAATGGQPERQGLALSRRGQERGELWAKARTAAIVVLTVGSLGVFGSAVIDSGTLSAIGDVAATAISGIGGGTSAGDGSSGNVAAAGAGGSGAAVAAADSSRSTPPEPSAGRSDSEASSPTGEGTENANPPVISDSPRFAAATDSLRRSIERYSDRMDLYREGEIGCPGLMSAREEAGRLFMRLSMFRLSEGTRPDSDFRTVYRQLSEEMEWVEQSYSQTECPRPSTAAPAESVPGGPPVPEPADSTRSDSVARQLDDTPSDSAGTEMVPADSAGVGGEGVPEDSGGDGLPAGQVDDSMPSGSRSDTTSATSSAVDSASDGQPADTTATGD